MTARPAVCLAAFAAALTAVVGCQGRKAELPPPPPPQVTVAKPVSHPVQRYYEYNGYLEAVEMVQIKARVRGFLQEIHFNEGDEVEVGEPLYTIDPREYLATVAKARADQVKAQTDVKKAEADIRFQTNEVSRLTEAARGGGSAATEVEKAKATLDVNEAQKASAIASVAAADAAVKSAELELKWTEIAAPIAGRISRTLVTKGNLVGQAEPTLLTTIVRMDPLFVMFDAPERDLVEYQRARLEQHLPSPTSGRIPVEIGVTTETGFPHVGRIDFRENRVDVGTGTVRIRGTIPNPLRKGPEGMDSHLLYPGLFARVRVPSGIPQPRLLVPEAALMTGQEGRYLYVVKPDKTVEKRLVTVGTRVGTLVAIDKGIGAGDLIIINGMQKARPDGKSTVEPQEVTLTPPADTPAGPVGAEPPVLDNATKLPGPTSPGGAPLGPNAQPPGNLPANPNPTKPPPVSGPNPGNPKK